MLKLPPNCLIEGTIPNPRKKKETQAEKDHVAHYHTIYGGLMDLNWFSRINLPPAVQKLLSYPESCLLVTEGGDTVGKVITNATISEWAGETCFLVHFESYAKLRDGVEVGTDITGFITPELKVIQELCHEWVNIDGKKLDRKIFLMREEDSKIFCRVIFTKDGEVNEEKTTHIPFVDLKTFVSESASILLQRLIVQQKKNGEIDLTCLAANGRVVKCNYRLLGSGYENVKGEDTKVWGIRRTVFSEKDKKEYYCWDSLYNYYGRLVLRCQPENDHAMIPLWFKPFDERDDLGNFIGVLPPLLWACDLEVYSHFLMKKVHKMLKTSAWVHGKIPFRVIFVKFCTVTELTATYKTYLVDHPQLRALLSDFLQKVLLVKPRGLIDFAKQFFQPFLLARPESEEGSEASSSSSSSWESNGDEGAEWAGEDGRRHADLSYLYPKKSFRVDDYFYNEDDFIVPPRDLDTLSDDEENETGDETRAEVAQGLFPTHIEGSFLKTIENVIKK